MRAQRPNRNNRRTRFDVPAAYSGARRAANAPAAISPAAMLRLAALIAVAACLFLGYRYLAGEQFVVRELSVAGQGTVAAQQIQQASGLVGRNVIALNLQPSALQESVESIKRIPGIEAAAMTCQIGPPAACEVRVQQSQPLVVFKGPAGTMWADRGGRVLRSFNEEAQPVLSLRVEDPASMPAFGTELGSKSIAAIEEIAALGLELSDIVYHKETGITLVLLRGQRVRIGASDEHGTVAEKVRVASNIASQLATRNRVARIIDVRFKDAPYFLD